MIGFWILVGLLAFFTLAIIGRSFFAGRGGAAATAAYDMQVYRDQLKELDRDVARGVIGEAEAERAKVEISRRLLEADRKFQAGETNDRAPRGVTYSAIAVVGVLIVGGGFWLYRDLGDPGYWDMPLEGRKKAAEIARETRSSQAELEAAMPDWAGPPPEAPADYLDLVAQLRQAVEQKPDELQGQELLAQHEAALGNFRAAGAAMARAIEIKGDAATASDYSQYADLLVLAAGGEVSPEAEKAVEASLDLDPKDPVARYYLGLMHAQTGRPDLGFPIWRDLLEESAPTDPWVAPLRAQIGQLAALAGVDYTPPRLAPAMPGLSQEDMQAAQDMTPEERADMINNMVQGLMDRLATEGGPATDWARLITALGVQGDTERARAIWAEAQTVFAGRPQDLAMVNDAAARAGLGDAPEAAAPPAGPTAEDMAAAAEMSAEDRAAMIDGMVSRLYDTLTTEGGPVSRWMQLFNALGVQGDAERATEAWAAAQEAFADDPAALEQLRAAATAAGATE